MTLDFSDWIYLCITSLMKGEPSSVLCLYLSSVAFVRAAHMIPDTRSRHLVLKKKKEKKTGCNNDETRSSSILEESLMNSDRKRHSSCSRLPLIRSRTQSTRGRKFIAPSLSVSASPWRQREYCKWRHTPIAGEASLKVAISATELAWRQTGTGPWRLFGDAQRCESKEREALWLAVLFLKASGTASHVCSSQSINEVASNLKETCFSVCAVDAFAAATINLRRFPKKRRTRFPWCWNRETWPIN